MAVETPVFNANPTIFKPTKTSAPKADRLWVSDSVETREDAEEIDSEEPIDQNEIFGVHSRLPLVALS
jgi:hypothetical protein